MRITDGWKFISYHPFEAQSGTAIMATMCLSENKA